MIGNRCQFVKCIKSCPRMEHYHVKAGVSLCDLVIHVLAANSNSQKDTKSPILYAAATARRGECEPVGDARMRQQLVKAAPPDDRVGVRCGEVVACARPDAALTVVQGEVGYPCTDGGMFNRGVDGCACREVVARVKIRAGKKTRSTPKSQEPVWKQNKGCHTQMLELLRCSGGRIVKTPRGYQDTKRHSLAVARGVWAVEGRRWGELEVYGWTWQASVGVRFARVGSAESAGM